MLRNALILIALILIPIWAQASDSSSKSNQQSTEDFKKQLETAIAEQNIPGAQLALFDDTGVYWSANFGKRDIENDLPVTDDTLFRAGSTTKTFIALAIMQLVEQGKLNLDDKVSELEPALKIQNPWRDQEPVRLIHLLEHTAGFDDMHFKNFYNLNEPEISLLDAANRDASTLVVRWKPGTRHAYSNPGYGILGHLIEKVSGQSYESYVEENILRPLGMAKSKLSLTAAVQANLSKGYENDAETPYREIYLRSAGSLNTTASELALLGQYLLTRGNTATLESLNAGVLQQMENPRSTDAANAGLKYGYGVGIYHFTRSNREWLGHSGGINGFLTYYGYSHELGKGFALMINTNTASVKPVLDTVSEYLWQSEALTKQVPATGVSEDISGYYRASNDRNALFSGLGYALSVYKVSTTETGLNFNHLFGQGEEYYHTGEQLFRETDQQHSRLVFLKDANGASVIQADGQYLVKVNAFSAWAPVVLLGIAFLTLVIVVFYFPVWAVCALRKKFESKAQLRLRVLPFAAVVCFGACILALFNLDIVLVSRINWQTLTIFLGSIGFACFSIISLWQTMKHRNDEPKKLARYFSLVSSVSCVVLTSYLFCFNYIGLALWIW